MIRRFLPLIAFLALAALLYAGIQLNRGRDSSVIPSPLIGKPAPAFSLPALHDPERLVDSSELRGRAYLFNVFASWCAACRDEHPVIERLAASGRLPVVGYNYKDERSDALRWLQQFRDPYALIVADLPGRVAIDYGVYGAPESFLIDAEGIIRYKHVGPLTWDVVEQQIFPLLEAAP